MYHPELQAMLSRYDDLVAQAERGMISVDDAMATLASMVVVDAAGVEWRLDANGTFLSAVPGYAPAVADPKMFTPSSSVTGQAMPWSPMQQTSSFPSSFPSSGSSLYDAPVLPSRQPMDGPYGAPPTGVVPVPVVPPTRVSIVSKLRAPGKIRTALVIAICCVIAIVLVNARGGDDAPETVSVVTGSTEVSDDEGDIRDSDVATSSISIERASRVVAALSGKQSGAALAVTGAGDAAMLDIAMPFAAAARLGYDVEVTSVVLRPDGASEASVTVSFGGDVISTWALPLAEIDGKVRATAPAVRS